MNTQDCPEMRLLLQAELDGELAAAEAARLHAHLDQCPVCQGQAAALREVSHVLRHTATRHAAPPALRAALHRTMAPKVVLPATRRAWARPAASFTAGALLAACLTLFLVPRQAKDGAADIVTAHIRALQPGHLIDVVSTDRHTVKPWFDGRLPFAPPVKDLAASGFPLAGGRLDYVDGHVAAALVYRAGPHMVDLFVWPDPGDAAERPGAGSGYNFVQWHTQGMVVWAVSDLNAGELAAFVRAWRGQ